MFSWFSAHFAKDHQSFPCLHALVFIWHKCVCVRNVCMFRKATTLHIIQALTDKTRHFTFSSSSVFQQTSLVCCEPCLAQTTTEVMCGEVCSNPLHLYCSIITTDESVSGPQEALTCQTVVWRQPGLGRSQLLVLIPFDKLLCKGPWTGCLFSPSPEVFRSVCWWES